MYDREWARRIVVQFRNVRTRTNNLDACIIERCEEIDPNYKGYTRMFIEKACILALMDKSMNPWWRKYQRLQKTSPLDKKLLEEVARYMCWQADYDRTMRLQREFTF
jgi:hypothetical protein